MLSSSFSSLHPPLVKRYPSWHHQPSIPACTSVTKATPFSSQLQNFIGLVMLHYMYNTPMLTSSWNLVIFLVKFVLVVVTLTFAIYRVESFRVVGYNCCYHSSKVAAVRRSPTIPLPFCRNYASRNSHGIRHLNSILRMTSTNQVHYAPSQVVQDSDTGERWRLCAGVAVLNSQNQVLVAERKGRPGNWQCPQGGVDDAWTPPDSASEPKEKETILQAGIRELYEETGLEYQKHVLLDPTFPTPNNNGTVGVRYSTTGTSNWLTQAGFAGQELHWVVFRCMDGRGDWDPSAMCDLSGKGGEEAEFTQVAWKSIEETVASIWEGKRAPYLALQSMLEAHGHKYQELISQLDFSGKWSRDSTLSTNVAEGLQARGLSPEEAQNEAQKPYIQLWEKDTEDATSWHVTTYAQDGEMPRRKLEYKPGTWEETYQGKSNLFGESSDPVTLRRQTSFVAEIDAYPIFVAQVTITTNPQTGVEESRRYRNGDGQFVLRRTLWPKKTPDQPTISTEIFICQE